MIVFARIVLSPLALGSLTIISVLLATTGTLFLAYDLLGILLVSIAVVLGA